MRPVPTPDRAHRQRTIFFQLKPPWARTFSRYSSSTCRSPGKISVKSTGIHLHCQGRATAGEVPIAEHGSGCSPASGDACSRPNLPLVGLCGGRKGLGDCPSNRNIDGVIVYNSGRYGQQGISSQRHQDSKMKPGTGENTLSYLWNEAIGTRRRARPG